MRLTTFSILVAVVLLAVFQASRAQSQSDPLSGRWDTVLQMGNNPDKPVETSLDLKLEGETVTGRFESSTRMGSGPITGSWTNNTLKIKLESKHSTIDLTGLLQAGKLSGTFVATGHVQGRWEATKKDK
jgi:hypothetical protein